jgi:hypothetical protein
LETHIERQLLRPKIVSEVEITEEMSELTLGGYVCYSETPKLETALP